MGIGDYAAAKVLRDAHGVEPIPGAEASADGPASDAGENCGMYSFGAQFVEARVNRYTGEIRVPRMLGVFSVGRVINPRTLRSQLIGGTTMACTRKARSGYRRPIPGSQPQRGSHSPGGSSRLSLPGSNRRHQICQGRTGATGRRPARHTTGAPPADTVYAVAMTWSCNALRMMQAVGAGAADRSR
jgi:hypothetical protein